MYMFEKKLLRPKYIFKKKMVETAVSIHINYWYNVICFRNNTNIIVHILKNLSYSNKKLCSNLFNIFKRIAKILVYDQIKIIKTWIPVQENR